MIDTGRSRGQRDRDGEEEISDHCAGTHCAFLDLLCCFPGNSSLSPEVNSRLCIITTRLPDSSQLFHLPFKSPWKCCVLAYIVTTLRNKSDSHCAALMLCRAAGMHHLNMLAQLQFPVDVRNPQIVSCDLFLASSQRGQSCIITLYDSADKKAQSVLFVYISVGLKRRSTQRCRGFYLQAHNCTIYRAN